MSDYTFFGRIHPERANLNSNSPTTIRAEKDGNQLFELRIHVYANQIMVRAKISDELEFDIWTVKNLVTEHVQSVIDLCSFLYQSAYEVEITSVINNNDANIAQTFGINLDITGENIRERAKRFPELVALIGQSPHIVLALADLRSAMKIPIDTGVYCYRAFESILQDFEVGSSSGKKAKYDIERMGRDLNIGSAKKLKKFLGKHAGTRRHGKAETISWEERKEVMKRVWLLLDRYFEYLKRGRTALSLSEFPEPNF